MPFFTAALLYAGLVLGGIVSFDSLPSCVQKEILPLIQKYENQRQPESPEKESDRLAKTKRER